MKTPEQPQQNGAGGQRVAAAGAPVALNHRAGDEEVLSRWYTDHASAVLSFATRGMRRDHHAAEDLVQEAFLRAWLHRDKLMQPHSSPQAWLLTTTSRMMIDNHRRRSCRVTEVPLVSDDVPLSDATDRTLSSLIITDALAALPLGQRAVLVELYLHGRTLDDTARVLGIPPGTVKSRSHYALRQLRHSLEEAGVHGSAT